MSGVRHLARMKRTAIKLVAYDYIVESDIPFRGGDQCPATASRPVDIRIFAGAPLATSVTDTRIYEGDRNLLDFVPPSVGRFRCRHGNSIEVEPAISADTEMVHALLIATALPALLWMRGAFVLHAAAVQLPYSDQAIAIAGPSGVGKSTILAQLVDRGARLIADDTVRLSIAEPVISMSGLSAGYFIREDGDKPRRFQEVPTHARCHKANLNAIFFLSRRPGPASVVPMPGPQTVEGLLANRHRPKVPELLKMQVEGLQDCARIAHRVPAYHWQRQEGSPTLSGPEWDALGWS